MARRGQINPVVSWTLGLIAAVAMSAGSVTAAANASTRQPSSSGAADASLVKQLSSLQAQQRQLDAQLAARGARTKATTTTAPSSRPSTSTTSGSTWTPTTAGSSWTPTTGGAAPSTTTPSTTTAPPTTEPPTTTAPRGDHDGGPGGTGD